jgi:beta-fructofuranosidase
LPPIILANSVKTHLKCICSLITHKDPTSKNAHLHVFNNGKTDIKVLQLAAWEMKPALMNGARI